MSHFTTLIHTSVNIENLQESPAFRNLRERKIAYLKEALQNKPDDFMLKFYLKEAQHPCNEFEKAVTANVEDIMAPFCECTEDPEYLEFEDHSEECYDRYKTETMTCVKYTDGSLLSTDDPRFCKKFTVKDGLVYEKASCEQEKEIRSKEAQSIQVLLDYPAKLVYLDFKDYVCAHCGYTYDDNKEGYGYYYNPNSYWDWYSIGGRWPYMFLVKDSCPYTIQSNDGNDNDTRSVAPNGYLWVCGARKCDIEWELMKQIDIAAAKKNFNIYESWFKSRQTPDGFFGNITDEGIYSWQHLLYAKGETIEEYLVRIGLAPEQRYVPSVYSYVQDGEWISQGDMGWFGVSSNDKLEDDWRSMIAAHLDSLDDDVVIVSVDCHI